MRIITCCSRSGSSFVCQLLHELGANFGEPDKLVKPDEWNKKGYFENRAINKINHELLFGSWSKPELWIDVMWPKDPLIRIRKLSTLALAPLASRKKSILKRGSKRKEEIKKLAQELKGQVVKDPRFCYIMQPWAQTEEIESVLSSLDYVYEVIPVETNILIFVLDEPTRLVDYLETKNIYCSAVSKNQIRFVTHFQFDDEMLEKLKEALIAYS